MSPPDSIHGRVSRKRLDEDCLLDGQLHPNIAERLKRIQELPVTGLANLRGVESDPEGAWLVWDFAEGVTLEEFCHQPRSDSELDEVFGQLRLTLAAMHSHGIVHGAVHERNVIVDRKRRIHLTHASPLLFYEPQLDEKALSKLIERLRPREMISSRRADSKLQYSDRLRVGLYIAAAAAVVVGVLLFVVIVRYISA